MFHGRLGWLCIHIMDVRDGSIHWQYFGHSGVKV